MFGVFFVNGGCVIVVNGVIDAICGYEGAEDAIDVFAARNGLEVRSYTLVNGWDEVLETLGNWQMPAFM